MLPNAIDDLFRNQLNDHATPPGEDLWARLAAGLAAEKEVPAPADAAVDAAFRAGLGQHASPVRRELWERLEDEHLRPRPRRAAGFWPLALAAVIALLVVAGGAGVWLRGGQPAGPGGPAVASGGRTSSATNPKRARPNATRNTAAATAATVAAPALAASTAPAGPALAAGPDRPQQRAGVGPTQGRPPVSEKMWAAQATRRRQAASSALTGTENGLAARPAPANPAPQTAAALVPTARPDAAGPALASTPVPAPDLASPAGTIEVEVRPGGQQARASQSALAAANAPADQPSAETDRPGRRTGRVLAGLLRQAGHLVQGQALSLAEATGHPTQTLTLNARLAGRSLSKSIQL